MIEGVIIIEGHVQGLSNARSAAEMGLPVWIIHNGSCIAQHSKACSKFYQCSRYDSEEFIQELLAIGKQEGLHNWLLIPSNDYAVVNLSRHKKELSSYFLTFSSDLSILNNIVHKNRLLTLAQSIGINIPDTYNLSSLESLENTKISFPVITKGVVGQNFYKNIGCKAIVSENKEVLMNTIDTISQKIQLKETFTQELILNKDLEYKPTVSVCCLCAEGEIINLWMGEKLNEHPVTFGTATLTRSVYKEVLLEPSKKLMTALKYSGICEIEWLYNPNQKAYNLIEINPRSWLWIELAKASGVNFIQDMIQFLNQQHILKNENYKTNIYWYNPITYYPFKIIAWFKKVPTFKPQGKRVNALFKKGDNTPGWRYIWSLINIFRNR